MRGSSTHGWGSKKKHRGSGNRGGFGFAGYGKRSEHYKPYYLKLREFVGKNGFHSHRRGKKQLAVNIEYIQQHLDEFVNSGKVERKGEIYAVDIEKLGYKKVLGSGTVTLKLYVVAPFFTKKAEEKIKKAGGDIRVPGNTGN